MMLLYSTFFKKDTLRISIIRWVQDHKTLIWNKNGMICL